MSETAASLENKPSPADRTVFGHPVGLVNLFNVELWERFSFYGMVGILGYYLYFSLDRGGLALPEATAMSIVGAYTGFVYLCTVLGGWLADRVFGMERMVFYGGSVVMIGHLALAVLPGLTGVGVGLVCVALGSGALKANASSIVGTLYSKGDPRCDGGFTLFYLGVNVGAFTGPLLTGFLHKELGFHIAFGAAAVGMAIGLTQYVLFRRNLGAAGKEPGNPLPRESRTKAAGVGVLIVVAIVAVLLTGLVRLDNLATVTSAVIALASIAYFVVMLTNAQVTAVERSRVRAFIPLFIANVAFWSLFQQIFTTLAVYSEKRMDWNIFGWEAPVAWIGSEEPVWVILLAPVFATMWTKLRERAPSTPVKFALGVIGMGMAFLLFLTMAGGTGRTSPALAVFFILAMFAVSELMLSPIGLSVTSRLAPEAFRAQMMALYYFSVGLGSSVSGQLAGFYEPAHEYAYFGINGGITIAIGLVALALSPWIKRRMEGVH
ncbi:peptide MFS transporter [Pseudonocardia spinosispora]|uniref:peptide MFS transporter n=1 Tax=Pseudonocardia spinosispora TaxID=103441 RepID=UPI000413B3E9|nr:oligopeptide:H+ symporter [Pseudonocardia spinosispora]